MAHRSIANVRRGIDAAVLLRAAGTLRCLGHPLRLRLLEALESGEKTVTELQAFAGSSQAAVSQHLSIMKANAVVSSRRDGTFVYYRIVEPKVSAILACIRKCDL
jgi:ArsR family transcriptional regulator